MKKNLYLWMMMSVLMITGIQFTGKAQNNCGVMTGTYANKVGSHTATVHWTAPNGADHYLVRGRNANTNVWTNIYVYPAEANKTNLMGLRSDATYIWQVKAFCDSLETQSTPWSHVDSFTTGCFAPTNLEASPLGGTAIKVHWDEVPGAKRYQLVGRKVGETEWHTYQLNGSGNNYRIFNYLDPNTEYEWTVRTVCTTTGTQKSAFASTVTFVTNSTNKLEMINDVRVPSAVRIIPNPVKTSAYIKLNNPHGKPHLLTITDMHGKPIVNETITASVYKFNRKTFSPGVYIVKVSGPTNWKGRMLLE